MRREVANSNERRRMQNINSGFDDLKAIVCAEDDGKISKVSSDKYNDHPPFLPLLSFYLNDFLASNICQQEMILNG